uniref:Protein dif-1 n=1 Tax=Cacopsylla melanoneura TaxID=428564 RepID=A0A8D9B9H2_9HEMI
MASWEYYVSGSVSGIATAVLVTPGERIKCLLQVQESTQGVYSGPIDVVRKLTAQYGVTSLFKGLCATLVRDVPAYGAYYTMYETVKRGLASDQPGQDPLLLVKTIVSGGMAGLAYWGMGESVLLFLIGLESE